MEARAPADEGEAKPGSEADTPKGGFVSAGSHATAFKDVAAARRVVLVRAGGGSAVLLEGEGRLLKKDFDVWPGGALLLEVAPECEGERQGPPFESDVMGCYEAASNAISVSFNHPDGGGGEYPFTVHAKRSETLRQVRRRCLSSFVRWLLATLALW